MGSLTNLKISNLYETNDIPFNEIGSFLRLISIQKLNQTELYLYEGFNNHMGTTDANIQKQQKSNTSK